MSGWTSRGAAEIAAAVRAGEVSAVEVAQAHLDGVARVDPKLNAFRLVAGELALEQAKAVDAKRTKGQTLGPLAGVPVGLKDIFVTKGLPTTCGSKILEGWLPEYDGTHSARLRAADAVLLGKLNMDEFAMGSSNENTPYGAVKNPWELEYVPGGSSGGTAAAVAAQLCPLALGTDTGGSIRQPASLCGVVGLKPTYGRVSRFGMIAFASSLDQAGPVTRNVRDAALGLAAIAGHDPHDATTLHEPVPDYLEACNRDMKGMRIGIHRAAMELEGLDPEVRTAFEASLDVLRDAGATLHDVELPHFSYAVATYYVLATAEASSNLARYDGIRYGARKDADDLVEIYEKTRNEGFGAEVKRRIMLGTFVLRAETYDKYYGRAMKVRTLICRDYEAAFKTCDLIASPTSPVPGFRIGERINDPLAMYLSDIFTIGANLAELPGISVPCGFSTNPRLPIGLQLIAPKLGEVDLLRAAAAYEAATSWHTETPEVHA